MEKAFVVMKKGYEYDVSSYRDKKLRDILD